MIQSFGPENRAVINTPAYIYDLNLLERTLQAAQKEAEKHNFHIHYALKANTDIKILSKIRDFNMGADCVSGNEIERALQVGFRSQSIVFAGVGKTDAEISYALDEGIYCFNCESIEEIEVINDIAAEKGKIAKIALRLNPSIKAGGHEYITTGTTENKFGIQSHDLEYFLNNFYRWNNIKCIGIHFHIGSQIIENEPFIALAHKANELVNYIESRGISITYLNLGGGLGINYEEPEIDSIPDFESYFQAFANHLDVTGKSIHFELGRSLVGQCGNLLTKVLYTKKGENTQFIIVDAGMTELLRPALYNAQHQIRNITSQELAHESYDVVGPVCESSDCFGKEISLPSSKRNDLILIKSCGAYAQSMSLQYNLRTPAHVYYDETGNLSESHKLQTLERKTEVCSAE